MNGAQLCVVVVTQAPQIRSVRLREWSLVIQWSWLHDRPSISNYVTRLHGMIHKSAHFNLGKAKILPGQFPISKFAKEDAPSLNTRLNCFQGGIVLLRMISTQCHKSMTSPDAAVTIEAFLHH